MNNRKRTSTLPSPGPDGPVKRKSRVQRAGGDGDLREELRALTDRMDRMDMELTLILDTVHSAVTGAGARHGEADVLRGHVVELRRELDRLRGEIRVLRDRLGALEAGKD